MNSYRQRFRSGELQRLLRLHRPLCVCLQHIGPSIKPPRGYQLATSSPPNEGHLRTAILVRDNCPYYVLTLNPSPFQSTSVVVPLPGIPQIAICSIYNQPSCNYSMRDLSPLISQLPPNYLVLGDFNAHSPLWGGNNTDEPGTCIEDLLSSTNLCCLNQGEPTYRSSIHASYSAIDLSLASDQVAHHFDWAVLDERFSSDHYPVLLQHIGEQMVMQMPQYNISKADWPTYNLLSECIREFSNDVPPVDNFDYFMSFITSTADASIPMTSSISHPRRVPWWTPELGELIAFKHKVERQLHKTQSRFTESRLMLPYTNNPALIVSLIRDAHHITLLRPFYNKVVALEKRSILQSKQSSWRNHISSFTCHTPNPKIWEGFRRMGGMNIRPPVSALVNPAVDVPILDSVDIANYHASHFARVSSDASYTDDFLRHKTLEESNPLPFGGGDDCHYNVPFTMTELRYALQHCSDSTPGPDKIPYALVRNLHDKALVFLLCMFNQFWQDHFFPNSWRHAYTIPVPKPGKDPTSPTNYRPIVLTSCLCKLMEKMIQPRLLRHVEESGLLSPFQNGSRPGRSTLHSLTHLEHQVRTGFKARNPTVAIFFDIAKAYDTTWRYRILKVLYESGMRGHLPKFLEAFLSDRSFQVEVNGQLSTDKPLHSGIPQGSVLSGLLFIIAIDGITTCLPNGVSHSLFVDDFAIYYTSATMPHILRRLNSALDNIHRWTSTSGFQISVEKTKAMIFYRHKRHLRGNVTALHMGDVHIPFCDNAKFLGLTFDSHLNWRDHIRNLKARCMQRMNVIKAVTRVHWGADRPTLLLLYKAIILSVLDYGCQIYGNASDSALDKLDPVHHQGIRLSSGAFRSSPINSLMAEAGAMPLLYHRQLVMMRSAIRIMNSPPVKRCFQIDVDQPWPSPSFPYKALELLRECTVNIPQEIPEDMLVPPWCIRRPVFCFHLTMFEKSNGPHVLCTVALDHLYAHSPAVFVYTDGSKDGHTVGSAAVSEYGSFQCALHPYSSVFTAELVAIKGALNLIRGIPRNAPKIIVCSDSLSALQAIQDFASSDSMVRSIVNEIHILLTEGRHLTFCWVPAHVGIQGNERADALANRARRDLPEARLRRPYDVVPVLETRIREKWRARWIAVPVTNQLRSYKDDVSPWFMPPTLKRVDQVLLTRLRIGHTRLTRSYLMSHPTGPPPMCQRCQTILTVPHILCECPTYARERAYFLHDRPLPDLLRNTPTYDFSPMRSFLKAINLYDEL